MWRPYGKESHSTRGSRECFGCVFDLRACTRQAVSLTPLYVMVLVSVCARRRAGPPVHVYDRRVRARAVCSPFAGFSHTPRLQLRRVTIWLYPTCMLYM